MEELKETPLSGKMTFTRSEPNEPYVFDDLHEKLDAGDFPNLDRYVRDILTAQRTGDTNITTQYMNALFSCDRKKLNELKTEYKDYFLAKDYHLHDKKNPTDEERAEAVKVLNDFIAKNNIIVDIHFYDEDTVVDQLLDVMSQFTDNHNPYPFLLFRETFDFESNPLRADIRERYYKVQGAAITSYKQEIYEKWKDVISTLDFKGMNKYHVANYYECLDASLKIYEHMHNVRLEKVTYFNLLQPILSQVFDELNLWDMIDKYQIALRKRIHPDEKLNEMFIEQYVRQYRVKTEIKLF